MQKSILVLVFISLVLVFGFNVNAEVCSIRTSCDPATETALFSLYEATDSHIRTDLQGSYKVCCPSSLNLVGKFDQCGIIQNEPVILKAYSATDSHVSDPLVPGQFARNVCLGFNENVGSGGLTCNVQASECDAEQLGIVSLAETGDSHVGAYNDYPNNLCCTINTCPTGFRWDGIQCVPNFEICLRQDSGGVIQPGPDCQALWMTPLNQDSEYWRDALSPGTQDCFTPNNVFACCYAAEFQGNTYGEYQQVIVKRSTLTQIQDNF